jgi:hypothetical protein
LFIIVIDFVMKRVVDASLGVLVKARNGLRHPVEYVSDIGFADNIIVTSLVLANLQTLVDRIVHEAGRVGLVVNVAKTKLMVVGTTVIAAPVLTISDQTIKVVEDFYFLSSWIQSSTCDFVVRRALAWRAAMAMLPIWRTSSVPRWTKRLLFRVTVEPMLLYSVEAWTMNGALAKRLDGTYT